MTVTPAIILDAKGYGFDFRRDVFVHSGSIILKTNPQNFDVYVNGRPEASKQLNRINNSYNLTGLKPGNYELSIRAGGFQTWSKKTEVHSGLASEFWNILLVRENYDRAAYNAQGVDKFFISPQDKKIASVKNSSGGVAVQILNVQDKNIENFFFFAFAAFGNQEHEENIEWSPNENYLSIPIKMTAVPEKKVPAAGKTFALAGISPQYTYFIADPSGNSSFNLNSFLEKDDIRSLRWDPKDERYVFFVSENNLYRANTADKKDVALIAENVSAFDLSKNGVYYIQNPNKLVFNNSLDGSNSRIQLTSDFPDSSVASIVKIIAYDNSRISLLSGDGNLFIFNKGDRGVHFRRLENGIRGMQFSDDGKKMLYWSDNEIFVYFLRDWNVQPARLENEIQPITRYSEIIRNAQWFRDYEHIIFSAGPTVKIIELDARDHRNCMDILKVNIENQSLTYDHSLNRLFFADRGGEISDLYSIVFPEPGGFLGLFPPTQQ